MVCFNHPLTIIIKKNYDKMQWVFLTVSAEEQKYTDSYDRAQSTTFNNPRNSRVKAGRDFYTCSYAKA